ncbi:unnamed protein product [Dracunculus medinensis]|uniref:G protein-coupled receptor n=1 Tax=Dracunculus medinensis TaxID=318479 RepID=A0A0N4UQB6_DRAME|nr:unnamed protein product [Dracunculus medinensis]
MQENSVNPIAVATPSAGNVLVLLNTLYTSGFASHSPSQPLLSGRTMHTLYAISFVIYSVSCVVDWIYAYCTLRGYVTSFPLKTEIVVALVSIAVIGSMLNALLLAFNNFRIVFLFLAVHDFPITIINFFFIAACRCVGPKVWQWPVVIITLTTTANVIWRLIMLYIAYQRMICPMKKATRITSSVHNPSFMEQLKANTSQKGGGRLNEYDECWPTRYSYRKVFGDPEATEGREELIHFTMPQSKLARCICCNILVLLVYKFYLVVRLVAIITFIVSIAFIIDTNALDHLSGKA